ncbi:hypothetical protein ABZ897_00675 [Nonomuraea sp. NPDC046802]|uniref:hypothetical protein n=1 Tax=Nonomuraea sp. NPDC046802 TaxID=3154919 RepID=UPI0033C5DAD1
MINELTEEEIRADERRKTAHYIAHRLRVAQRAELDGGNDARWAAFVVAETIAECAARGHMLSPASPDSSSEEG